MRVRSQNVYKLLAAAALLGVVFGVLGAGPVWAEPDRPEVGFTLEKKLRASDGAANDEFGYSVSLSGSTLAVGANGDNSDQGAVYLFERDHGEVGSWGQVKKLTASDGAADDEFGYSVSLSGDRLLVGAYGDDSDKGAAYLFERDQDGAGNWGQVKKLAASDGVSNDRFGHSVTVNGDRLVVGAHLDDDTGSASGSGYLFEKNQGGANNWGQVKKLVASDGSMSDLFGFSVSLSDNRLVVGAIGDGNSRGSVYLFERDQGGAGGETARFRWRFG